MTPFDHNALSQIGFMIRCEHVVVDVIVGVPLDVENV